MKNDRVELKDNELEKIAGGSLTEEQSKKAAGELGNGSDMGAWKTMSSEEFMKWWNLKN